VNEPAVGVLVDDLFRQASGRIVATLTRLLGVRHLALAEEAAQDALVKALQIWPFEGVPASPTPWLIQVARNAAIDRLRRDRWLADRATLVAALEAGQRADAAPPVSARLRGEPAVTDDRLTMLFLTAHPALAADARVALMLKIVCGFGIAEIARALLAGEAAIAQRLVRAKRTLRDRDVALDLTPDEYAARLPSVLDALYLMFNEGYAAHAGDDLVRAELCAEAIRLATLVAGEAALATPAVDALLALMCLQAARLPARVDEASELLRIDEQDRARWDQALIARGLAHLERAAAADEPTPYHLEAGIAACHAVAAPPAATDWARIVDLYDALLAIKPSPIVALNRAIAISRLRGAAAGLAALEPIAGDRALRRYHLLPATLGELWREAGDAARAADCYRDALACECTVPERRFLERRLAEIAAP
jgi:RNA polymerase sigma-70 factor (ECF subfamily)